MSAASSFIIFLTFIHVIFFILCFLFNEILPSFDMYKKYSKNVVRTRVLCSIAHDDKYNHLLPKQNLEMK